VHIFKNFFSSYNFQKLTPVNDVESTAYTNALNFVFNNNDIRNVAISGTYEAGKSSVIESYKAKHVTKKFIHISFACSEDTTATKQNNQQELVLESKIVNQLIYQIDLEEISGTNFKVKQKTSQYEILKGAALFAFSISLLLYTIFFDKWVQVVSSLPYDKYSNASDLLSISSEFIYKITTSDQFNLSIADRSDINESDDQLSLSIADYPNTLDLPMLYDKYSSALNLLIRKILIITTNPYGRIYSGIFILYILSYIIWLTIKTQKDYGIFKRISLGGNEIEILKDDKNSYFDKYLSEVLYLFEYSGAKAVVFEDIDEFATKQIFSRLREINTLVNNKLYQKYRGSKEHIKFFYLIRDDIFTFKDRTKFFDFIIPIIPAIDSSNSYEKFIEYFKEGRIFEKFDVGFLQNIALYIDDMRMLKNIYNELRIYQDYIQTDLDNNKLLAIIIYKNFFPKDFRDLQLNKGCVYTLLTKKQNYIKTYVQPIETIIKEKQKEINSIYQEHPNSIDELDTLFFNEYSNYCWDFNIKNKNAKYYTNKLEFIKDMKTNPYMAGKYQKRLHILEDKMDNKIQEIKNEIKELEHKIVKIQRVKSQHIIDKMGIDIINNYEEININNYKNLIIYMIYNGFIDETYHDYMNISKKQ
jgi:hypothetical protein